MSNIIWRKNYTGAVGYINEVLSFEIRVTHYNALDNEIIELPKFRRGSKRAKETESENVDLQAFTLSLSNIISDCFNNYDQCEFLSMEEAMTEAERLRNSFLAIMQKPLQYYAFKQNTEYHAYIDEMQVAEISRDSDDIGGHRQTQYVDYYQLSLDNIFRDLFRHYDRNKFETLEEAQKELERLRELFLSYFGK